MFLQHRDLFICVVEKFQIINKGEANQRCSSETLVKCLKITKEDCETASNAAAEVAKAPEARAPDA